MQSVLEKKPVKSAPPADNRSRGLFWADLRLGDSSLAPQKQHTYFTRKYSLFQSFRFALHGLRDAFRKERNFRIHCLAAAAVVTAGFVFHISLIEWAFITFAIFFVTVCEMINTAMEQSVDFVNGSQYHPLVKRIKDTVAASVLLASLNAVVVGVLVFGKYIVAYSGLL